MRYLRNAGGAQFAASTTLPNSGRIVDCATDHFGNVYVVDDVNSRILKYTAGLSQLAQYGSYGTGGNNLNTLAHPTSITVPSGVRWSAGQQVWYGEGGVVTTEEWGTGSGMVAHRLGVEVPFANAWGGPGDATFNYQLTDHGFATVFVWQGSNVYRTLEVNQLRPSGWNSAWWDGNNEAGDPAPAGTYSFSVHVDSPYGCSGEAWCQAERSAEFWHEPPPPGGCGFPICPEEHLVNVFDLLDELNTETAVAPARFFVRQMITAEPPARPLFRLESGVAAGAFEPTSFSSAVSTVRTSGITTLRVGIPGDGSAVRLDVRIHAISGAPVRRLVTEAVEPGEYAVTWDGLDNGGRPAPEGVYVAVVSAGPHRVLARLILKRR